MAITMTAMMVPTAAPFFVAYARERRRPVGIVAVVLIYVAVWASIGYAVGALMGQAMMPGGGPVNIASAVLFTAVYTLMPWSRWARDQCREMCRTESRGAAFRDGLRYSACCVLCSAGVMAALVVLGMSNALLIAAAAGAMLVYKLI